MSPASAEGHGHSPRFYPPPPKDGFYNKSDMLIGTSFLSKEGSRRKKLVADGIPFLFFFLFLFFFFSIRQYSGFD